uniref:Mitochondria-eating protein C-terminal domain-containing protein n=1 Tax=Magallana gigas TaxID=29159 RepID=K1QC94_MAGGI
MAKSKKGGFFSRSFSLPNSRVRKGQRIERNIEERQEEEEEEIDEKELHNVLRMIKTLAVNAKKDFKKKKVYRYYCEEMIDRWIPDLKRLLRIRSREEKRHREEADAQRENDRRETQRELRNFSKGYDNKRNRTDEVAALKNKHEDELVRQNKEHDDVMTALKREHQREVDRLSQTAGDKLRENNPNFSDLSDPYRPTKLSEMFSELNALSYVRNLRNHSYQKDKDNLVKSATKKANEMRREMATWTINGSSIYHALWEKLEESFGKDDVEKCKLYIQKCVQCCWLMCVQDPALQLTVWTIGTKMDGYNMKSFTKNGQNAGKSGVFRHNMTDLLLNVTLLGIYTLEEESYREQVLAEEENFRHGTNRDFKKWNQAFEGLKEMEKQVSRLSEVAGARLRDKNPGISDLSDSNRPLKLNEKIGGMLQEEEEIYDKELHNVLRMIKTLAVNAKKDFKKKKLLRIRSREERRHREEADAQRENDRRETQRELRNFSKGYDNKRNRTDEVAALKNKHEDELVRQKKEHDDAMTALKREHQREMDRLLAEKEKLLTRLSQTAGDKLRENNPNFSDLSDPYRPTKLSEIYFFQKCFELCKESSESQLSSLRDACCGNVKNDKDNDLVKSAKKAKEMRREMATWTLNESRIYHALWEKLEESFGKDDVEKCKLYIQKCVQCCWFMCVQDPALQLTVWTIGTKMDGYNMKSFTKNGQLSAEEREKSIHEALREMKRLAISAKDKYKKDRKKKTRSSQEYVYDCQTLIQTSIPKLKQLLGINTLEEERAREQVLAEEENFRQGTSRDFRKWNQAFEGKKKYEDEIKSLHNQHKKEVASLQREKEGILQRLKEMEKQVARLSQVAGARLRDNNPGISDLSDPNRPLKLNEKISELYDNEWTDAIENLETDQSEQTAIAILLNIVMRCFRMCQNYAKYQLTTITKALMLDEKVSTSVAKCAKDAQKTSSEVVINESSLHTDPPMCLVDFGRGLEFNSNEMRSFTKSGKFVDFVVWPALYLHEDGPLLSKAVVQGSNHPAQQNQQTNQKRQHEDSMRRNDGEKIKHSKPVPKQQKANSQTRGHLDRMNDRDNQSFNSETQRQHHDHYDGVYNEGGRMNPRDYDQSKSYLPPLSNKGGHLQSRQTNPPYNRRNPQGSEVSPSYANSGIPHTVYRSKEYRSAKPVGRGHYNPSAHGSKSSYGHEYYNERYKDQDSQYSQSKQNPRYGNSQTQIHHTETHSYQSTEL